MEAKVSQALALVAKATEQMSQLEKQTETRVQSLREFLSEQHNEILGNLQAAATLSAGAAEAINRLEEESKVHASLVLKIQSSLEESLFHKKPRLTSDPSKRDDEVKETTSSNIKGTPKKVVEKEEEEEKGKKTPNRITEGLSLPVDHVSISTQPNFFKDEHGFSRKQFKIGFTTSKAIQKSSMDFWKPIAS
jgi:hypothetical protein